MKDIMFVVLVLLILAFTIKMAIHVYHSRMSNTAKLIWIAGIIMAPLLGATLYYISDHGKY